MPENYCPPSERRKSRAHCRIRATPLQIDARAPDFFGKIERLAVVFAPASEIKHYRNLPPACQRPGIVAENPVLPLFSSARTVDVNGVNFVTVLDSGADNLCIQRLLGYVTVVPEFLKSALKITPLPAHLDGMIRWEIFRGQDLDCQRREQQGGESRPKGTGAQRR